jgi:hypothetical protein
MTTQANLFKKKVDSLINTESVVMFEKSWCLFSKDAKEFLVGQLGVSIHLLSVLCGQAPSRSDTEVHHEED